jgi:hypothetical protein
MAAFGLGYSAWLGVIWPVLLVSMMFILTYCWVAVKEDDIIMEEKQNLGIRCFTLNVLPFLVGVFGYMALGGEGPELVFPIFGAMLAYYIVLTKSFDIVKLNNYINWRTVAIVALIFASSGFMQEHNEQISNYIKNVGVDIHTFKGMALISLLTFIASFSMGSDGKFAALTVLMASAFGKEYLLWFFALDYTGYLLTPMHECVMIGKRYFGTPLLTYYTALVTWAVLMLTVAGLFTFL